MRPDWIEQMATEFEQFAQVADRLDAIEMRLDKVIKQQAELAGLIRGHFAAMDAEALRRKAIAHDNTSRVSTQEEKDK